jgi:hypothetical protein
VSKEGTNKLDPAPAMATTAKAAERPKGTRAGNKTAGALLRNTRLPPSSTMLETIVEIPSGPGAGRADTR